MNLHPLLKQLESYIGGCISQPSIQMQHLSGAGNTYLLEQKLCNHYSKKYAVAYCNATTALMALCGALQLKRDKIISTPFNWGGSISPFLFCNNKVCFSSVEDTTLNIAAYNLSGSLSNKTKVILSTDFNGTPADSKAIKGFCKQHGLFYISDSAQSLGAYRYDKPAGFYADAIVLSFSPGKSFFAGEGGAILTDDAELYEKLIWYSQHPARQKKIFGLSEYNEYAPINGRCNPLSAIMLSELFEPYLTDLKNYQANCFTAINKLREQSMITLPEQLQKPENSTFFNLIFQISGEATFSDITSFINSSALPLLVEEIKPRYIPFDRAFKKQFSKQYNVSPDLIIQKKSMDKTDWIKLTFKT